MYLRLQLLGTGSDTDPFRVSLPSYTVVSMDTATMQAIVSCGDRVGPSNPPAKGTPLYPMLGDMFVLIGLPPSDLAAWWAKLEKAYPGRATPFTPNFP